MTPKHPVAVPDSDPSFIRGPVNDLFNWGGRLGMSHRELLDAVADGLIRPDDKPRVRDEPARQDPPDITLP